ncbi:hypothetical protein M405DRAFT_819400 [Rhizopogon salebrosus TDB-379]|nr:hypothetical protein M405DRAFT_819400 [Rhizopogon salebrosus TDB-379]
MDGESLASSIPSILPRMNGMELANRYTPLGFLARKSTYSGYYVSEYEDALALDQLEKSSLFDSS